MESQHSLSSVLAVFIVIAIGIVLKKLYWKEESFWKSLEDINYHLFFPLFIFVAIIKINSLDGFEFFKNFGALLAWIIVQLSLAILISNKFKIIASSKLCIMQSSFRCNTYIGLSVSQFWFHNQDDANFALVFSIAIILFNVLSELMIIKSVNKEAELKNSLAKILKNPILISCILGLLCVALEVKFPVIIVTSMSIISNAALAVGLLCIGSAVANTPIITSAKNYSLWYATIQKILISPIIMYIICSLIGVSENEKIALVLIAGLPSATIAYLQIKRYGGDSNLMANIIFFQTFTSAITIYFMGILLAV